MAVRVEWVMGPKEKRVSVLWISPDWRWLGVCRFLGWSVVVTRGGLSSTPSGTSEEVEVRKAVTEGSKAVAKKPFRRVESKSSYWTARAYESRTQNLFRLPFTLLQRAHLPFLHPLVRLWWELGELPLSSRRCKGVKGSLNFLTYEEVSFRKKGGNNFLIRSESKLLPRRKSQLINCLQIGGSLS